MTDNFDIKKFVSEKSLLNENSPGYDTRKQGEALPTLASVKAAYEAKNNDINEGVWKIGNPDDINKFIETLTEMKHDYWNVVGSDDVMDGIDRAIKGSEELLHTALNPLRGGGSYNKINEGIIAEAKKSELDIKLSEIDKAGAITTLEAKIAAIDEAVEAKNSRINMVQEDENLSELIDKKRVKEMQKEIKLLERSKKVYEKQLDKVNGVKAPKKEMVDEYNTEPHNTPDSSAETTMDENGNWIQKAIKRPGALHRELGVPQDEDIPKGKMDAAEDRLEDEEERDHKAGRDMSAADRRELRQIDLARTLDKFN
tara:strand:- start:346 stop:1284 length:939 start_codon:yes stop_codon:yes gene_type:complete